MSYSPWPESGKTLRLELRRAVWARVTPWYGDQHKAPSSFRVMRFWFPFVSIKTRWFHIYAGWKPITLDDPKFYWRNDARVFSSWKAGDLFVQLSTRWGTEEVS